MTRETKVGLVVASAFVGLTTVVVVSRLKPSLPTEAPARAPIIVTAPTPQPQSLAIPGAAPGATPGANPPKVLPASAFEAAPLNGTQDPAPPSQTIKDGINPQTAPALPQTQSANPAEGKPEFDFKIPEQMAQNPPATANPPLPTPGATTVPASAPAVNPNTKPETPALPTAPASPPTATAQDPKYRSLDFHKPSSPTTDPAAKPANPQPISPDALGPAPAPAVPVPGPANPLPNPDVTKPNPTAPSPATPNPADLTKPATPGTTPGTNPAAPAPLPTAMSAQPGSPGASPPLPAGPGTGAAPGQAPLPPAPLPATPAAKPLTDPAPVAPPAVPGQTPAGAMNPAPVPAAGSPAVSPAPAPAGLSGKPAVETPPTGLGPNPAPVPGMPNPLTTPGAPAPAAPGTPNTSKNDLPGGLGDRSPKGTEVTQTGAQEKGIPGAVPPVGAPANVGSPPIQVPVPAPAPKAAAAGNPDVRSWEVQTYTCKPEDTSLKALSARFYKSPDYAEALLRYNRDSLEGAPEELRADPPQPRAGTRIQIPPVWLLEARYPGAIPNLKPLPDVPARGSVSTGQSSPVSQPERQPPVVAVTPPAGGPSAVPPVPVPTPGQGSVVPVRAGPTGGVYTVARGGEPLFLIAQRTLGDGNRWPQIYRLNQNVNPSQPIPEGTQLLLPADARIPR